LERLLCSGRFFCVEVSEARGIRIEKERKKEERPRGKRERELMWRVWVGG